MIPLLFSRALRISRARARQLASCPLTETSFSVMPAMAPAITPIPPALATAEASPDMEIPTPMPPWMMGRRLTR